MAGKIVSGAAAGAALGTAVPVVGNVVGAIGGAAVGALTGLFSSKKHYHLYYWDPVSSAWVFVMDGHPSQVNPASASYQKSGMVTAIIRNKDDKAPDGTLAPAKPPTGYVAGSAGTSGFNPWIVAGIAGGGLVLWLLLRKGSSPGIFGRPR